MTAGRGKVLGKERSPDPSCVLETRSPCPSRPEGSWREPGTRVSQSPCDARCLRARRLAPLGRSRLLLTMSRRAHPDPELLLSAAAPVLGEGAAWPPRRDWLSEGKVTLNPKHRVLGKTLAVSSYTLILPHPTPIPKHGHKDRWDGGALLPVLRHLPWNPLDRVLQLAAAHE